MEEKKPSLSELLENANAENQRQINDKAGFEPDLPVKTELDIKSDSAVTEDTAESAAVSEEDEIIDKYSQRVKTDTDPRTSTANLRESLAALMEKDKDLVSYYNNGERKNKKFDELYTLINTASISNVKHRSTEFPKEADSHFVSEEQVEKPAQYKQQKLFGGDETLTFKTAADTGDVISYDEEYEKLGKKIENGEISFTEEENEDQLTLTDDTPAIVRPDDEQEKKNAEDQEKRDKKDFDLMYALQMMDEDEEKAHERDSDAPKILSRRERRRKNKEAAPQYEYTERSQNGAIDDMLRQRIKDSRKRTVFTGIILLAILYLELSTKGSSWHPSFLQPGRNGILYILIDLQMLFFGGIVMRESILNGFISLARRKPTAESVMSVSCLISAAYSIVTLFTDRSAISYGLICLPAAASLFSCALIDFMTAVKDAGCFKIIADQHPKYVAEKLRNTAREGTEFYKYLLDDSELYTVKRSDFVDGFFSRINRRPEGEDLFGFLITLIIIAAGALLGLQLYLGKPPYEAYTSFSKLAAFALPVSAFFIINLPAISANLTAKKHGSALIGRAVGEEYADASVISFADTEVYPSSEVRIISIKTYGEYRIDQIIGDLAKVFKFVGGPLKKVTAKMVSGIDIDYRSARLIESASDGICVVIDGNEMFLGKKSYLRRYRFETPSNPKDEQFEQSGGSIMYVTTNDMLIAKVYIKYKISKQFNALLRDMYRAGMCVGIKTVDPNITTSLLEHTISYKKCPISILKAGDVADVEGRCERIDSGIVSTSSLHTFLRMFIICDKVRHVTRSNAIINVLSVALAFFVSFFLAITGELVGVSSFYPVLFQLLWLLPIGVISFIL